MVTRLKCQDSVKPIFHREKIRLRPIFDINRLKNNPKNFEGGKIRHAVQHWREITSDSIIIRTISGSVIDFVENIDHIRRPFPIRFCDNETKYINKEIQKLLRDRVITPVKHCEGEFISTIFTRPKKDGSYRVILNLKNLNVAIDYKKFKMDSFRTALNLVTKNCFFASCDLSQAYYACPVHPDQHKLLRFKWENKLYEFNCFVNGLAEAPRKFTKIMNVAFSHLRKMGHTNTHYIDDSLLIAQSYQGCAKNITDTVTLLDRLGFTIHPEKSVLYPSQSVTYLGFYVDSVTMTVQLTQEKLESILELCIKILNKKTYSIRNLAQITGKLVSTEPGVPLAPLFYHSLEIEKTQLLNLNKWEYDAIVDVSEEVKDHLRWWIQNLPGTYKNLLPRNPDCVIRSDSSGFGWGGVMLNTTLKANGLWSEEEKMSHINFKELHAAFLCLRSFVKGGKATHVRLELDNTTAVAYINNMGGKFPHLHELARKIWFWALENNLWLSATHLAGVENVEADFESRKKGNIDTEWKLNPDVFREIMNVWPYPTIDLFASRLNFQLEKYVAWRPDPNALAIDAMNMIWTDFDAYLFPPFSLLGGVLRKLRSDGGSGTLVAPLWTTQPWFVQLLEMATDNPRILGGRKLLSIPWDTRIEHPLRRKLHLAAFRVSGDPSKPQDFQRRLPNWPSKHGGQEPQPSIGRITKNGAYFVVNEKLIKMTHL